MYGLFGASLHILTELFRLQLGICFTLLLLLLKFLCDCLVLFRLPKETNLFRFYLLSIGINSFLFSGLVLLVKTSLVLCFLIEQSLEVGFVLGFLLINASLFPGDFSSSLGISLSLCLCLFLPFSLLSLCLLK